MKALKSALLALAAVSVLGMTVPVQAQDAQSTTSDESYAYQPADAGSSGCAMQGTYAKGADYANCY